MDHIAIISDIHGNLPALEAVLQDIQRRDIGRIFCLGDLVGKGPDGDQVIDLCQQVCEATVRGNWDDGILANEDHPLVRWHQAQLGRERLAYLAQLPHVIEFTISGKRVRLFHASQIGVYHRVHMTDAQETHLAMFTNTEFTGYAAEPNVVGYGDIHGAFVKSFQHKILFNAGSVGNPLDFPQAAYAILEGTYNSLAEDVFSLNIVRVPYDIERAVRHAEAAQMPNLQPYINELRTARYRGTVETKF